MLNKKSLSDINVLGKCKILIEISKLCDLHGSNIVTLDKYILLFIALMMLVAFVMVSLFWFIFDHGFILSEVSYAIPIFIGCSEILLESFPLIIKNQRINETVNRLQSIVRTRKFPLIEKFRFFGIYFMM